MSTRRFSDIAPPPLRVVVTMAAVLAILLALVVTAGRAGAADGSTDLRQVRTEPITLVGHATSSS
jgi:hypothetical protein